MSVILLSDPAGQWNPDEHRAFELSAGRTLTRLRSTPPGGQQSVPPRTPDLSPRKPARHPSGRDPEPPREMPASAYLPASG